MTTRPKRWPREAESHRQRAIQHARRIVRLGDQALLRLETAQWLVVLTQAAQVLRWIKATQTEMIRARQTPKVWPRIADNVRLDILFVCEKMLRLVKEAETAVQGKQRDEAALAISQLQAQAQDIELMLNRAGE